MGLPSLRALDAKAHDLAIPEKFGIYHTVGDTSGPGGWARAIRNFRVFQQLGRDIARHAPRAVVLNYTNPMTCLTDVLARTCANPVVGLCHGLFENLEFIKRYDKLDSENQIAAQYAGVNHFFWMTRCAAGDVDVIADLRKKTQRQSLSKLLREVFDDPMGHRSGRELATELFRQTGVLPGQRSRSVGVRRRGATGAGPGRAVRPGVPDDGGGVLQGRRVAGA